MTVKGLPLTVYHNAKYRGCAAGGISERFDEVVLIATCDANGLKTNANDPTTKFNFFKEAYYP
jgi:hypothetical protein